jgi:hypothetical protein
MEAKSFQQLNSSLKKIDADVTGDNKSDHRFLCRSLQRSENY